MSTTAAVFAVIHCVLILLLPRALALVSFCSAAFLMTMGSGLTVAGFWFPIIRIVIGCGLIRIVVRREYSNVQLVGMDKVLITWCLWLVVSSVFHHAPADTLQFNLGFIWTIAGSYVIFRVLPLDVFAIESVVRAMSIVLLVLAVEMISEQVTGFNSFSTFGGVPEMSEVRNGRIRSQGPFGVSILAGTAGAVMMPLFVGYISSHKKHSLVGLLAATIMVLTSHSSGPLMTVVFGMLAVCFWKYRSHTKQLRIYAVMLYIVLDIVMKAPAYYLMARIDFTGSSTGFHRAQLIESAVDHLDEWFLAGTDYTRHWMITGVTWSEDHADITNYYLKMGVIGGMPLLLLFVCMFVLGFKYVGIIMANRPLQKRFEAWCLGASLFAHACTCLSISYFDQTSSLLFLLLATLANMRSQLLSKSHALAGFHPGQ